MNRSISKSFAK
uniref:Uncharacterized protein n=1 Tax=Arundo donax TaxID=35708 RepID=A0A0A9GRR2_ARUDO